MLRISVLLLATSGTVFATAAYAANTTGTVTAIDEAKHTVTLSDDMVYTTSPTMDLGRLKLGYTIRVSFTMDGATNRVNSLEILVPAQPSGY